MLQCSSLRRSWNSLLIGALLCLIPKICFAAVIFDSATGTGPYDRLDYRSYESEIRFLPERTMRVTTVKPRLVVCSGECVYTLEILEENGRIISTLSQATGRVVLLTGKLARPVLLRNGKVYRIRMALTSSKERVGIFTAGGEPFPNRRGPARMELVTAGFGLHQRKDRGPIAFILEGITRLR